MSFTFKHIDEYCIASRPSPIPASQGQVFKIDGRYMAVANWRDNRVSFVTKVGSWLDGFNKDSYEFVGPIGDGFKCPDAPKAIVVAGGTGIGAAIHLMNSRKHDQETHLLFYSRTEPCYSRITTMLGSVPHLTTLTHWNTKAKGRPSKPLDLLRVRSDWKYDFPNTHIFVIGPKSLVDAVREQCKELGVPDENFHLNY